MCCASCWLRLHDAPELSLRLPVYKLVLSNENHQTSLELHGQFEFLLSLPSSQTTDTGWSLHLPAFFFTCSWSNNSSPSYKLHMCWLRAPASGGRQNAPSKRKQCLYYIYMCFLLLQLIINVIMMIIEYFIYFGILCTFICVFCFCFLSFVVTF